MSLLDLAILILATYGISSLLVDYDGYADIFLKFRIRYPHSALQCVVCTSCYIAPLLFVLGYILFSFTILLPFAAIGGVISIQNMVN